MSVTLHLNVIECSLIWTVTIADLHEYTFILHTSLHWLASSHHRNFYTLPHGIKIPAAWMHVMLVLHLFPFVFRLHFLFVFSYVVGCCFFSFRVRARSPVFFIISFFLCYVLRAIHYFMHWFRLTPMSYTFYAVFCFLHSALLLFLFFFSVYVSLAITYLVFTASYYFQLFHTICKHFAILIRCTC